MVLSSLPPEPKIKLISELFSLISEADKCFYLLNGSLSLFPENHFIISTLLFLEAVYSNSIDDYSPQQKSPFKLLIEENQSDLIKIYTYLNAMSLGQKLIRDVASSSHIIKSIHKEFGNKTSDKDINAGEFRKKEIRLRRDSATSSVIKYIPPPPEELEQLMNELENYIASDISYPVAINAALVHAQFEMIHPFEMNNGLVGRILFQLHLLWKKRLCVPAIQFSKVLFKKRVEYFDQLEHLEKNKNWEVWIKFFLQVVIDAASQTIVLIKNIYALEQNDYQIILDKEFASVSSLKLYDLLFRKPIITLPFIVKELNLNKQTANVLISKFLDVKILEESTGMQRNRVFVYKRLTNLLEV